LVAYERYTEKKEARKREEGLRRWMGSQEPPAPSEKPPET